jgi:hypothetical protein
MSTKTILLKIGDGSKRTLTVPVRTVDEAADYAKEMLQDAEVNCGGYLELTSHDIVEYLRVSTIIGFEVMK